MIPDALEDKIFAKNIPIDVQFELTWRCNQKCIHCYQFPPDDGELGTAQIKDIISQLAHAGTLYLSFTGGEPLLRKDFWEIAEFALNEHFAILLQTNGILIDRQAAETIAALNFFAVHISLLGATCKTHDSITKTPGSFDRVLEAIGLLRNRRIKVILNVTLMRDNFFEFEQIKALKNGLGDDVDLRISPYIFFKNDGGDSLKELRLNNEQLKGFFEGLAKESKEELLKNKGLTCDFGCISCTINARGEVYPCVAVPMVVGDLKKQSFREIWGENPILKQIRNFSEIDLVECRNCSFKKCCFRCSGFSFTEKQNIFSASDENCRFAKIVKEVTEDEKAGV